jgi:hypothetical protein
MTGDIDPTGDGLLVKLLELNDGCFLLRQFPPSFLKVFGVIPVLVPTRYFGLQLGNLFGADDPVEASSWP